MTRCSLIVVGLRRNCNTGLGVYMSARVHDLHTKPICLSPGRFSMDDNHPFQPYIMGCEGVEEAGLGWFAMV